MSGSMKTAPQNAPPPEVMRKIVADAESLLQAQLTCALAADQRALLFAGFLVTVAVALVAGVAALVPAQSGIEQMLFFLGLFVVVFLLFAAVIAIYTARPQKFYFPGSRPNSWREDLAACRPYDECLQELSENLDTYIDVNGRLMARNGRLLRLSMWLSVAVVALGAFGLLTVQLVVV